MVVNVKVILDNPALATCSWFNAGSCSTTFTLTTNECRQGGQHRHRAESKPGLQLGFHNSFLLTGFVFSSATHGTEWLVIATYPELHADGLRTVYQSEPTFPDNSPYAHDRVRLRITTESASATEAARFWGRHGFDFIGIHGSMQVSGSKGRDQLAVELAEALWRWAPALSSLSADCRGVCSPNLGRSLNPGSFPSLWSLGVPLSSEPKRTLSPFLNGIGRDSPSLT